MKQKFFTLLLGLAMVSLGAVAQSTVSVSISKLYGATTLVCNQDLDFSTVATTMRPYYIIEYAKNNGNFKLEAFNEGKVPANTPMILIGKQYPTAGKSEVITCDVPVATSIDDPDGIRKDVFTKAQGWAWLMPVINGNYTCPNFNAELADRSNDEKAYNVTFFNYSSGAARVVPQTESVPFGQSLTQSVVTQEIKNYYKQIDVSTKGVTRSSWSTELAKDEEEKKGLFWEEKEGSWNYGYAAWEGDPTDEDLGKRCIMFSPSKLVYDEDEDDYYTLPKLAAVYTLGKTSKGKYRWTYSNRVNEGDGNYEATAYGGVGGWVESTTTTAQMVSNYVNNPDREVYNYVLSVNSSGNPVFKLCNGASGTTVPYGKCYVSVWSDVKAAASSREDIGIEFAEDEEDLSELNEEVSGIKNVNIKKEANGIYNINGQKLVKLQKGLNIVNGKKVYVK